jgi:ATP-dependent Lhr-like helicase
MEWTALFAESTVRWFRETLGEPTDVQCESWNAIARGENVLVSAPTGMGKTLAAFLIFIDRLKKTTVPGEAKRLRLVYISPLKALGNDIRVNLTPPLTAIAGPALTAEVRTGDTSQAARQHMLRHPPDILITTPESLYLLLGSSRAQALLSTAEAVIVDECHALFGNKRGAHLLLSLARLDRVAGHKLQRIGLSATVTPLSAAASYLAGGQEVTIVAPPSPKMMSISVRSPLPDFNCLEQGSIWPEVARLALELCEGKRTVIAFVDGRMQAEKLAHQVNLLAGDGFARTHHGSISKEQRQAAEQELKSGTLRLLCATSSMELGIDVGEVDLILQLGYPSTIASVLQRLGRSGHGPGRLSEMVMIPRTAHETLFCALSAHTALQGGIEDLKTPGACLDVLAQHLVSMSLTGFTVPGAREMLRQTEPFTAVADSDLADILRMLAGDYEHERDVPVRPRLLYDRLGGVVKGDAYSRMLAFSSGGAIPDRGYYPVYLSDGTKLGELEEEYVYEARVGDRFMLGAFAWRIASLLKDRVIAQPSSTEGAQPPFWKGDSQARSAKTGRAFGVLLRELRQADAAGRLDASLAALGLCEAAVPNAGDFFHRQNASTAGWPDDRTLVAEHFCDQTGAPQLMLHALWGRAVNAPSPCSSRMPPGASPGLSTKHMRTTTVCSSFLLAMKNLCRPGFCI